MRRTMVIAVASSVALAVAGAVVHIAGQSIAALKPPLELKEGTYALADGGTLRLRLHDTEGTQFVLYIQRMFGSRAFGVPGSRSALLSVDTGCCSLARRWRSRAGAGTLFRCMDCRRSSHIKYRVGSHASQVCS